MACFILSAGNRMGSSLKENSMRRKGERKGGVVGQRHPALLTTTIHAFGPPTLKVKSFRSSHTSNRDGTILSTAHPSAKASRISFADTLRGPRSEEKTSELE